MKSLDLTCHVPGLLGALKSLLEDNKGNLSGKQGSVRYTERMLLKALTRQHSEPRTLFLLLDSSLARTLNPKP